jgi:hypothetical protein
MPEDSNTPREPTSSEGTDLPKQPPESAPKSAQAEVSPPAAPESTAAQASKTPTPPATPTPASITQTGPSTLDKSLKLAQEYWIKVQPVLKEKSIQVLLLANRFTNHFLDNIWPKLSAQAVAAIPDSAKAKVEVQKEKVQPTLDKVKPAWEKGVVPFYQKVVVPNWLKLLAWLRQRLPQNLATELTNRFLTIVILAVAFVLYSFFSSLTGGKPAAVAKQPAPKPVVTRPAPTRPVPARPAPTPVARRPLVSPSPAPTLRPRPVTPSVNAPAVVNSPRPVTPTPSSSPVAVAPKPSPSPVPVVVAPKPVASPSAAPVAMVDLADLRAQLSGAANDAADVADGFVASVKVVEPGKTLQAKLGETWYSLTPTQQDQVAQALWSRSQQLKFPQLVLRDGQDTLIGRSPVVGSKLVILRR